MDIQAILKTVDHTLLRPEATWPQIKALCDEGVRYGVATVCVPPAHVANAAQYLNGNLPVCTVISQWLQHNLYEVPGGAGRTAKRRRRD